MATIAGLIIFLGTGWPNRPIQCSQYVLVLSGGLKGEGGPPLGYATSIRPLPRYVIFWELYK